MDEDNKIIYRLDDNISFRKCTLFNGSRLTHGNCTNFYEKEENWKDYYYCNQHGIHFHCTKHPEIELDTIQEAYTDTKKLRCPKCNKEIEIDNLHELISRCLKMLNIPEFKGAKLVRLDDWYVPEVKKKEKTPSGYWIRTDVKTDRDGDTIIVVYVGNESTTDKTQFFIKPEKLQLTTDHKDLDPAKILSKIEITLKDRTLSQKYDESSF